MSKCSKCSSQLNNTPIYKGEKIIGVNFFCTSCENEFDKPSRKAKCSKCKSIIVYYDKQDFKMKLKAHLGSYYYKAKHEEINGGASYGAY